MPGVSTVYDARSALGARLREIRRHVGMTGRQLAEALQWQASKISKIENGKQTPSDEDIRAWTRVTDSVDQADDLLASLHTLESQYAEWRRVFRTGFRSRQNELAGIDNQTRLFRIFEATVVPGLLQTAEYARARYAEGVRLFDLPDEIDAAVAGRIKRQDMLYRPDKRFHFVLTEAALRFKLCPPAVMLGQLDRLISLAAFPNVKLGIIAFETFYTASPWHGFWLHDNERVSVETFSAGLNLAQPQETELYAKIFGELAAIASYGRPAREIIMRVHDDTAQQLPDE